MICFCLHFCFVLICLFVCLFVFSFHRFVIQAGQNLNTQLCIHVVVSTVTFKNCLFLFCCRAEISRLQRIVELKTKEMNRVKRLAKTILDQVRSYVHVHSLETRNKLYW